MLEGAPEQSPLEILSPETQEELDHALSMESYGFDTVKNLLDVLEGDQREQLVSAIVAFDAATHQHQKDEAVQQMVNVIE
jgi:hypothetical protein